MLVETAIVKIPSLLSELIKMNCPTETVGNSKGIIQYSFANMIVSTRWVTFGLAGSGECIFRSKSK